MSIDNLAFGKYPDDNTANAWSSDESIMLQPCAYIYLFNAPFYVKDFNPAGHVSFYLPSETWGNATDIHYTQFKFEWMLENNNIAWCADFNAFNTPSFVLIEPNFCFPEEEMLKIFAWAESEIIKVFVDAKR